MTQKSEIRFFLEQNRNKQQDPVHNLQTHISLGACSTPLGSKPTTPREPTHNALGASSRRGLSREDYILKALGRHFTHFT